MTLNLGKSDCLVTFLTFCFLVAIGFTNRISYCSNLQHGSSSPGPHSDDQYHFSFLDPSRSVSEDATGVFPGEVT